MNLHLIDINHILLWDWEITNLVINKDSQMCWTGWSSNPGTAKDLLGDPEFLPC